VTVSVNARVVTVKGPRGELTRRFKHTDAEMEIIGGKKRKLKVTIWFGKRKNLACIRTICTHIKNMIVGVTKVLSYRTGVPCIRFSLTIHLELVTGLRVQDEVCLRPFPRELQHPRRWQVDRDPQLLGREGHPSRANA
jgi:large subunit ribosomal protein L9e